MCNDAEVCKWPINFIRILNCVDKKQNSIKGLKFEDSQTTLIFPLT